MVDYRYVVTYVPICMASKLTRQESSLQNAARIAHLVLRRQLFL